MGDTRTAEHILVASRFLHDRRNPPISCASASACGWRRRHFPITSQQVAVASAPLSRGSVSAAYQTSGQQPHCGLQAARTYSRPTLSSCLPSPCLATASLAGASTHMAPGLGRRAQCRQQRQCDSGTDTLWLASAAPQARGREWVAPGHRQRHHERRNVTERRSRACWTFSMLSSQWAGQCPHRPGGLHVRVEARQCLESSLHFFSPLQTQSAPLLLRHCGISHLWRTVSPP